MNGHQVTKVLAMATLFAAFSPSARAQESVRIPASMQSQCALNAVNAIECLEKLEAAQRRIEERNAAKADALAQEQAAKRRAARLQAEEEQRRRETPEQTRARLAKVQKSYDDLMRAEAIRTAEPTKYACQCNGMSIEGPFDDNDPLASCKRAAFQQQAFREKVLLSGVCPRTFNNTASFELKCTMGPNVMKTYATCEASLYRLSPAQRQQQAPRGGTFYNP